MPLKNGKQVCVNHPEQEMMTHAGYNALVKVSAKKGNAIKLDPFTGIPCLIFMCPICGYIELYNAKKHESWENPPGDWEIKQL